MKARRCMLLAALAAGCGPQVENQGTTVAQSEPRFDCVPAPDLVLPPSASSEGSGFEAPCPQGHVPAPRPSYGPKVRPMPTAAPQQRHRTAGTGTLPSARLEYDSTPWGNFSRVDAT